MKIKVGCGFIPRYLYLDEFLEHNLILGGKNQVS